MLNSLYLSASGMMAQLRRQDVTSNNLANANTTGFRRDVALTRAFPLVLGALEGRDDAVSQSRWSPVVSSSVTDFSQGALTNTGNAFDLALTGNGFFAVRTAAGTMYTRSGNLDLDANGTLVTTRGEAILDTNGSPITISSDKAFIDPSGRVLVGGRVVAQIGVTAFADPRQLVKLGDGLFTAQAGTATVAADVSQIRQGFLEASNSSAIKEMVAMIEIQRTFEANQKVIKTMDQSLDVLVNQVGRSI